MAARPLSREEFGDRLGVSRETLERLSIHLELLRRWQPAINLVGAATLADPWRRHFLDSAQLAAHVPSAARSCIDVGSGAGFPGMVLALLGVSGVHLIESDRRKAQFLREVARATGAAVAVHAERIERLRAWPRGRDHRACAGAAAAPAATGRAIRGGGQRLPVLEGRLGRARIDRCPNKLAYGGRTVAKPVALDRGRAQAARSPPCA